MSATFRPSPDGIRNNRKRTNGRRFHYAPVKLGTLKVFQPETKYPPQEPQPHVGIADFGAMRRGYHLGSILLLSIFAGTGSLNLSVGELTQWRDGPILSLTKTTINAADV